MPSAKLPSAKIGTKDYLLFALAVLPSAVVAMLFYDFGLAPFEDAAMLLRYADHLAAGEGIVWNPGEAPVDGATDFLLVVMVAGLHKLGLSLENAVRGLSIFAHLATLWVVFRVNVRLHRSGPWLAAVAVAYLALGPALMYLESYFGTSVFALAGVLTYAAFLRLIGGGGRGQIWAFAGWGLVMGLIRPEGVLLAGAMLLTLIVALPRKEFLKVLGIFSGVFGVIGGAYFAWHWWYFGHPLPNPFYVKGGGALHYSSLQASILNTIVLGLPFWPLFLYGLWRQHIRPQVILLLAPVAGFVAVWILMSNAMNYGMRFQYVLLPILMVAWVPVLQTMLKGYPKKWWLKTAGVILVALALAFQFFRYSYRPRMQADGRVHIAKALAPFAGKGYTMAITEAGNLPFYSGWHAIDTWGLNDATIAHQGLVTTEYLDKYDPELIMVHDFWSPGQERKTPEKRWSDMAQLLEKYAEDQDYELIAAYGTDPQNTHLYYLRRGFTDFAVLRKIILRKPYVWPENGRPATNYADRTKE